MRQQCQKQVPRRFQRTHCSFPTRTRRGDAQNRVYRPRFEFLPRRTGGGDAHVDGRGRARGTPVGERVAWATIVCRGGANARVALW